MTQIQGARPAEIITPLGDDVLLFNRMTATEQLGRLFEFELDLLSKDPDIKFEDILGQNVTVRLTLPDDKERYFNGYVSRFSQEGTLENFNAYHATVHPWLWFLTRTADCRIFQQQTVPDIIKTVFRDHGFSDFEESLSGSYRTWEYCVQYRETDFNFVSRLMEQEGIYYYFKHEKTKHIMVLSDSVSSHEPYPGYEKLPYYPPDEHFRRERDHIYEWTMVQGIQPGVYALNDFDFERPKANIQVKSSIQRDHAHASMEIYDYPGEYLDTGDGETYTRARIEAHHVQHEQVQAKGNARGLAAGSLFELTDYPRKDQNREYLVLAATHQVESDTYAADGATDSEQVYTCSFSALNSKRPFRSSRTTPKPIVQGPQTAVVVGPAGDEIYTDKYGRVKVSFHWDRRSKSNETSSCWVRVAQVWAGKQWGGIHIPRIGQEVIIEFLEGDPDHPIITGRVYNNDNMPPYDLPANATQSGIKSRSSKSGTADNFNEIRFEDMKGEEEIYLHGEKNWTINIENDKNQTIDHDETLTVKNDRTKSVEKNQSESIGEDKTIEVGKNHSESIGESLKLTIGKTSETEVSDAMTVTVGKTLTIQATDMIEIISSKGISFSSGSAGVTMDEKGDIKMTGTNINVVGSDSVILVGPSNTIEL
jgi:type VI secretion system secreted protein VgrG